MYKLAPGGTSYAGTIAMMAFGIVGGGISLALSLRDLANVLAASD